MALIIKKTMYNGIEVNDAYCKVASINNLDKKQMIVNVEYSADNTSTPFLIERKSVAFDISGTNPIEQSYNYLKTLDEFVDAIDC